MNFVFARNVNKNFLIYDSLCGFSVCTILMSSFFSFLLILLIYAHTYLSIHLLLHGIPFCITLTTSLALHELLLLLMIGYCAYSARCSITKFRQYIPYYLLTYSLAATHNISIYTCSYLPLSHMPSTSFLLNKKHSYHRLNNM